MYDLFGDKFDLNHDGRLSAAEHMMDFSVFNYWATDDDDDFGDGNEVAEALEDIGINLDEFESMSFKEQCEALEEAGLDPDEHRF